MGKGLVHIILKKEYPNANKYIKMYLISLVMNSMKRQKDLTLKDELPRSIGAQYASGEEWRNNSRKNEETEPKPAQLWMWLVMEVKSNAVKRNIA